MNPRHRRSPSGVLGFSKKALSHLQDEDYDALYLNQWVVLPSFLSALGNHPYVQL